ncbi:histidine kinase dimerization/phospho-acceptor domain-containing protein [Desulfurivibrio dismutans]|uniref:histidine kinase dimerization/phospho-acceptor domain-containing protein n=1 Tax=Desulfurivibrio dismutans TaxID=1398908 RepID=UPI0023DA69C0|nr:histidine kinase dimerization/phospho-acceptor domain-containing protein [Desulfurivibrio alkaliphilus]MDF1614305.1 histidine kinase dimerization/phospho-acceptor domain-containing protein [Desulfurivibrio alkaliphilus]
MAAEQAGRSMAGVRFCGEVSAAVSHEIKNVLAIIKETAGLLGDHAARALAEEQQLPPEQVREATGAIDRQVRRADGIVRRLNRFAHSVDRESEGVELGESCRLLAELATRLLAGRSATLQVVVPEQEVTVQASRFRLLHFLWRGLESVLAATGPGARLQLVVSARCETAGTADAPGTPGIHGAAKTVPGGHLELSWQAGEVVGSGAPEFPGPAELELLAQLAAEFELNPEEQRFVLLLP